MVDRRQRVLQLARRSAILITSVVVLGVIAVAALWHDRPQLTEVAWSDYPEYESRPDAVTLRWLGVSTLLFDDGDTQILIDGFFSRPSLADLVFDVAVQNDIATIDFALEEYQMRRLAAIIPAQSHFDHAMDIGAVANRSSASILGSESSAQIARGAGVPEDQIVVAETGQEYAFGSFTVRLLATSHAPIGWGGSVPYAGDIDAPLKTPAPVSAWRASQSYSIIVAHPQGTTLIQASAGFLPGALDKVSVDVALLGTWGLDKLGRDYAEQYWLATITTTGAKRVMPIHFDDYTRPFGVVELSPRLIDNFATTASWLTMIRDTWDNDAELYLPEFGRQMVLYAPQLPET